MGLRRRGENESTGTAHTPRAPGRHRESKLPAQDNGQRTGGSALLLAPLAACAPHVAAGPRCGRHSRLTVPVKRLSVHRGPIAPSPCCAFHCPVTSCLTPCRLGGLDGTLRVAVNVLGPKFKSTAPVAPACALAQIRPQAAVLCPDWRKERARWPRAGVPRPLAIREETKRLFPLI